MAEENAFQVASKDLVVVDIDQSVREAHRLMREKKLRHLVVLNEGQAIGILSDRDVMKAMRVEIEEFYSTSARVESFDPALTVRNVMSWPVQSVDENTALMDVIDRMLGRKISSLLVTKNNKVVGIITTDDMLQILKKHLMDEQVSFWGEDVINNVYSTPIRTVMEVLSNTGI